MTHDLSADILIVDDDEEIVDLLEEGISKMGDYRIAKALSGSTALKMVEANPPDLVLLDIMMPDLPGTEVCRAIKANEKTSHIPVIALTVVQKVETVIAKRIKDSGVDEHITKPFRFSELESSISHFLSLR